MDCFKFRILIVARTLYGLSFFLLRMGKTELVYQGKYPYRLFSLAFL